MPRPDSGDYELNWLYSFKKKTLLIIIAVLAAGIILTMISISSTLKTRLMKDNLDLTNRVGALMLSSLKHLMITGNPALLQNTFEEMGKSNHIISSMFIIDSGGRIVYSSYPEDLGKTIDRFTESSCLACHEETPPSTMNTVTHVDHESVQRVISLIRNDKPCLQCHQGAGKIIGKLIIDRSMHSTASLITSVNVILFAGGILCIALLVPLSSKIISRGLNKYIGEILKHHNELKVLYLIVERLSKTLDIKELRGVVIDIIRNTFNARRLTVVTPGDAKEYHAVQWDEMSGSVSRKHIRNTDDDYPFINSWLDGTMNDPVILREKGKVFLPIVKRNTPLALIILEDGEELFEQFRLNLIRTVSDHIAIAFENARLYHIAITDELTHLYTQRFFRTSVEKQFLQFEAYGEKIALLLIDIDDFKIVNDSYGHVAGDFVLKIFSQVLMNAVRDNDLAFRYGGEEFTVILPSTDRSGALIVAERIRKEVEEAVFEDDDLELRITVSIGVSVCPDHAVSAKDLILKADRALYSAKQSGKNRVMVSS